MARNPNLESFKLYYSDEIQRVDSIECDENLSSTATHKFKRIAYISILDALAGYIYPTIYGHRKSLKKFINKMSGWADGERISITHLKKALLDNCDPQFETVRLKVNELYNSRTFDGNDADISSDPTKDEIKKIGAVPDNSFGVSVWQCEKVV